MTSRPSFFSTCIGVALVCCALGAPRASFARESGAEHAQRARVAYDLRDWASAAREFRSAYESEPKSEYLFGLAQALRQARDYAGAIFTFKAYKRADGITPQQATAAELLITQCEAEQAKLDAQAAMQQASAARVPAASTPQEPLPTSGEPTSSAPPAEPASMAPAALGDPSVQPVDRAPAAAPFYADAFGDVLFVAGLGAASVGTVLLTSGNSRMRDSADETTEAGARSVADDAHSRQVLGSVLCPVGGALLIGAVWRWLAVAGDGPAVESVSVGPRAIQVSGRF